MRNTVAVVGAGVSGLTSALLLVEHGYSTTIFADEIGDRTNSAAAGAIWFPYDVEPLDAAVHWALESYTTFQDLSARAETGVSMVELRTYRRTGVVEIPQWAASLGATLLRKTSEFEMFSSGFTMQVPLIDTAIYLNYLHTRFTADNGRIHGNVTFDALDDVPNEFPLVINCAGIGARTLVPDPKLEAHRGQVVIVPKLALGCAVVCDDAPLMYAIPRPNDMVFGGTNELSDDRRPSPADTAAILAECSRVLNIEPPKVLSERVGLRPYRRTGLCLGVDRLGDNRTVIHNYGHGGSGFTLSWGCAQEVLKLAGKLR